MGSNQSKKAVVMLRVTVEPITPSHVYLQSADLRAWLVPAKNGDISHGARCLWMCKQKGNIGYVYVHEGDIWLQQPTQHPPKTHSDISGERISRVGRGGPTSVSCSDISKMLIGASPVFDQSIQLVLTFCPLALIAQAPLQQSGAAAVENVTLTRNPLNDRLFYYYVRMRRAGETLQYLVKTAGGAAERQQHP